jgi:serine/threonine-protein kinase RsbW/sigma-B regulation protein RsbU (phosphoserine phosphatase)
MTPELSGAAGLYAWLDEALPGGAAPADTLARMHVALEEAVVNAVLHGFPDGGAGEITVRLSLAEDTAQLTIEDNGLAFDPTAAPEPAHARSLSDAAPGGWGLALIHKFCPTAAYERRGETNRLTLRFALEDPAT